MIYELTAQPIHEDGSIGFEKRSPLFLESGSLAEVFANMAGEGDDGDCGIGSYIDEFDAWDLTLTIREGTYTPPTTREWLNTLRATEEESNR